VRGIAAFSAFLLASPIAVVLCAAGPDRVTRMDPPAKPGSMAPNLSLDGATVVLSWLEPARPGVKPQDGDYALRFSRLVNGRWTEPVTIAAGSDLFANWADFPSVTAGAGGRMVAHWAAKSAVDTYAYDVRLARSDDGGKTWRPMGPAHDDRTPTEHGFVSAVPEGDRIRIFWLDGRETGGGKGSMALRTALVGEHVERTDLLDSRVCDCCQTAAAMTSGGAVVAYRDRSDHEIRDIALVRRGPGGWTAPKPVAAEEWEIAGCPVNGPAVAASGRRAAVAWYTQGANRPRVQVAFSQDAGASFAPPIVVDRNGPLGRVDVVLDENGDALVLWVASEGKAGAIRLARVTPAGKVGTALAVSATETSRSSGFPRLERAGSKLVITWVEPSEPFRLRAATLPVAAVSP